MGINPFRRAIGTLLVAGAAALLSPPPANAATPASADPTVIDTPGQPLGVVAAPDGLLYVSDYSPAGGVSVFKPGETKAARQIQAGLFSTSIAMTSDGTLYVLQNSEDMHTEIGVVEPGANEVSETIPLARGMHWLTAAPDGSLYVASPFEGTVSVVLPGQARVERVVEAGPYPVEVTVAKDGTAYATNQHAGTVTVVPGGASGPSRTIDMGRTSSPHGIAAATDGTVYVANVLSNDVAVIEPGATEVARRIRVGREPQEVVAAPDGTVYVTNAGDNTVSVIQAGTDRVAETVPTGEDPAGWQSWRTAQWR
ncbi:YVTN family beta-propeller protein [Pseudarthrobacter sp. W1I19]|uniref:YncE family protein n=1 Tax=Pseudarthrobacter sp. W1I19 TaxID=3042288 RepID=UPI00278AE4CD|nr:YncE family protein [Pseudarthrobacter sp. W1I19]MDQ0924656.1 YVTN family beta-propeller protein [Pseudarthrobacter sp. W1I19]